MAFQADYGKGMELNKPADPFQQRLQQSAPSGPPPVNPALFRSNPFAKMGGMGARAAMAQGAPQGQPPPQAPAYGVRSRQQGGMAPQAPRSDEFTDRDGNRRVGWHITGRANGAPQQPSAPRGEFNPQAAGMWGRMMGGGMYGDAMDRRSPGSSPERVMPRWRNDRGGYGDQGPLTGNVISEYPGVSLTPPPTGMPGGIMGERPRMDQFREFGQRGGFDPLRERLMAQRGGGMPPQAPQLPQAPGNPFFDRLFQQPPPAMGRPGPPIMQEDYPMSEPVYY